MKAGTIFTVSSGVYDGFKRIAVLRMLRDVDLNGAARRFLEAVPEIKGNVARGYSMTIYVEFVEHLVQTGYAEKVFLPDVHVGARGDFREDLEDTAMRMRHANDPEPRGWVPACFVHSDCAREPDLGAACANRGVPRCDQHADCQTSPEIAAACAANGDPDT